jgi:hypothetical protein
MTAVVFTPFVAGHATLPMRISADDLAAFDELPQGITGASVDVTDVETGLTFSVRRAACGLVSCACAAQVVFTP